MEFKTGCKHLVSYCLLILELKNRIKNKPFKGGFMFSKKDSFPMCLLGIVITSLLLLFILTPRLAEAKDESKIKSKIENKNIESNIKTGPSDIDHIPQYPKEGAIAGMKNIRKAMHIGPGGDLSFTIPLLTIPGKIEVPINLTYSSGIKKDQSASWVGLGWNLGSFAVTRLEVFGNDAIDDTTNPKINDTYEVVTPTDRYCFINYGSKNHPRFVSMNYSADSLYCEPYRAIGFAHKGYDQDFFILTTTDGTKYIFGYPLKKRGVRWTEILSPPYNYKDAVNCTWLLTSILGPDYVDGSNPADWNPLNSPHPAQNNKGSWVAFTYSWDNQNEGKTDTAFFGSVEGQQLPGYHEDTTVVTYPYRIVTPTHVLQFETSEKNIWWNLRYYRSGWTDSERVKDRKLNAIRLYKYSGTGSSLTGKSVAEYGFEYEFDDGDYQNELKRRNIFNEGGEITLTAVFQGGTRGIVTYNLGQYAGSGYRFDYCSNPGHDDYGDDGEKYKWWFDGFVSYPISFHLDILPERWNRDFFGYRDETFSTEADTDATAWSLTRMILPTGGSVAFKWENDQYRYDFQDDYHTHELSGGGTRIKKIITDNGLGKIDTSFFTYGINDDGYGYPNSMPDIYFKWLKRFVMCPEAGGLFNPITKFLTDNVSHTIQYPKITEHYSEGGIKENYYITSDSTGFDSLYYARFVTPDQGACLLWVDIVHYYNVFWDRSPFHGLPYKNVIKDSSGNIISFETRHFSWHLKHAYVGSQAANNFPDFEGDTLATSYFISLDSVVNIKDGVKTKTSYTYDEYTGLPTRVEELGSNDNRITIYDYAYNYLPGMRGKHMLSQIYQTTVVKNPEASGNYMSSNRTTWNNDFGNSSQWYVSENYRWKDEDKDGNIQENEFLATQAFNSYDEFGNPTQWSDANGVPVSVDYDSIQCLPTTVVNNAVLSEISAVDFEEGTYEDWNNWSDGELSTTVNHTGDNSWHMEGGVPHRLTRRFEAADIDTDGVYVLSGWVKTTSQYPRLWWFVVYDNGSSIVDLKPWHASGSGEWEYLEAEMDFSQYHNIVYTRVYVTNYDPSNNSSECWWDDLRFHPKDGLMTTSTYTSTHKIRTKSDENSQPTYYFYDYLDRLIATTNGDKKLASSKHYFPANTSSSGIPCFYPWPGHYPSALGSMLDVSAPEGGYVDDFSENSTNKYTWSGSGDYAYDEENQVMQFMRVSSYGFRKLTYATDFNSGILSVDYFYRPFEEEGTKTEAKGDITFGDLKIYFYDDSTGNSYVARLVGCGSQDCYSSIDYIDRNGNIISRVDSTHQFYARQNMLNNALFARIGNNLFVFYNGSLILQAEDSNLSSFTAFQIEVRSDTYKRCIDNIAFAKDPVVTTDYFDGLGQKIQSQQLEKDGVIVSGIVYDESNRPALVTKAARYDTPFSGYRYDFIKEGPAWKPGYPMTDSSYVNTYYNGTGDRPDCGGYPYAYTKYLPDPDNRITEQGFPGSDFRIGSGHSVRTAYGGNSDNEISGYYMNELFKTNITDENGVLNQGFTDRFGNQIATIQDSDGLRYVTKFVYDVMGKLIKTMPPKANQNPNSLYNSTYEYNTLGQLINKFTPDDSTSQYIYDKNGNLRFSQDQEQSKNNYFTVRYYDAHNRLTLVGIEKDQSYDWTTGYPSIDDNTFGRDADEWRIRYFYDQDYIGEGQNYCKGMLTKEENNFDNGDSAESYALYKYDKFGNIIEKRIWIDGLGEKIVKFEYDVINRLTKLISPDSSVITYSYDNAGRLHKVGDGAITINMPPIVILPLDLKTVLF
jgi:YD repeat-containing protein